MRVFGVARKSLGELETENACDLPAFSVNQHFRPGGPDQLHERYLAGRDKSR